MKPIPFTFGGKLCIETVDGNEVEIEIGPRHYRALMNDDGRYVIGDVVWQINEARPGKPDLWVNTDVGLPAEVKLAVIRVREEELAEEQRRLVALYDSERRQA